MEEKVENGEDRNGCQSMCYGKRTILLTLRPKPQGSKVLNLGARCASAFGSNGTRVLQVRLSAEFYFLLVDFVQSLLLFSLHSSLSNCIQS